METGGKDREQKLSEVSSICDKLAIRQWKKANKLLYVPLMPLFCTN